MSQPLAGYQWNAAVGTGVGTTVLSNRATTLVRVVLSGTYIGTIKFHDAASAAGTTSTSQILSFTLPATSVAGAIEIGAECKKGLVAESTGTPTMTVIWN